jgi:hypothetical protein
MAATAAHALGRGLAIAGFGAVALGSLGFHPAVVVFGILCSAAFFIGRSVADRIQAENAGLSLPSQNKKR